ncbi:hypothetical protein C1H46_007194 [Malus baccata]|uniref:Uncharacterized protein n=1 Tax=Malus baccata TaxID=106549 RepID=A0A540N7W0_MALBA|nr:hypothetical protein C1H46_007194 [Malus baccata]
MQAHTSKGAVDGEGPAWALLRDNYILTNPKLNDWDKMPVRIFNHILLSVSPVKDTRVLSLKHVSAYTMHF